MRCFYCGKETDDNAEKCPHCLHKLSGEHDFILRSETVEYKGAIIAAMAAFLLAAVTAVLILTSGISSNQTLFSKSLVSVYDGEYWGYADKNGKEKIEPQYDFAYGFASNGLAAVVSGSELYYINTSGKKVLGPYEYDSTESIGFFTDDGLAFVEDNGKYGYINKRGDWVIQPQYMKAGNFSNGYAAVKIGEKYGFINTNGILICDFMYDAVRDFSSDGYAAVKLDGKWQYIDGNGDTLSGGYDDAQSFSDGFAAVKIGAEWNYIDTNGDTVVAADADDAGEFFDNGLAAFCTGGKWGYLNTNGDTVVDARFESADKFCKAGFAAVKTENGMAVIDENGELITDDTYLSADVYDDGYAVLVGKNGCSVINCVSGKTVISGYAFVSYDKTYKYITFGEYHR